jgi:hypothetical protein
MSKREAIHITTNVGDAVDTAYSGVQELADEMRSWHDNLPENLQYGSKGEEVDTCATDLEDVSQPEVPDSLRELVVDFYTMPLKKRASRSDRLYDYLDYARQAIIALNDHKETIPEGDTERHDEVDTLIDDIQQMIDEAEGVSFPGMY